MVIQSDFNDFILNTMNGLTYTADIGSSATVNYTDNALTTTTINKTATVSVKDQNIKLTVRLESGEANSSNLNAVMFKTGSDAIDKSLFTTIVKTSSVVIDIDTTVTLFIE